MEKIYLPIGDTFLKTEIFIENNIVYARNGYDKSVSEFIPFLLSKKPIVLDDEMDFNISYNDIFDIQDFIVNNLDLLLKLANGEIDYVTEFLPNCKF